MSRISVLSNKKALVLAVSSVLAGWITSSSSYAAPADNWPPKQAKTITAGTTEEVPDSIIIQDKCKDGKSPCNVNIERGTLINNKVIRIKGPKTSIMASGSATIKNSGLIQADDGTTAVRIKGGDLTITGSGHLNASKAKAAISAEADAKPSAEPLLTIDGTKVTGDIIGGGNKKGDEGKGFFLLLENDAVINGDVSEFKALGINGRGKDWEIGGWLIEPKGFKARGKTQDVYLSNTKGKSIAPGIKNTLHVQTLAAGGTIVMGDEINNLHIQKAAEFILTGDHKKITSAKVNHLMIASDAKDWKTAGWATGTKKLYLASTVSDLYLSDVVNAKEKDLSSKTLRIAAAEAKTGQEPKPIRIIPDPDGEIEKLHVQGDAHMHLGVDLTVPGLKVKDIIIDSTDDAKWQSVGWFRDPETLEAKSKVNIVYVSDLATTVIKREEDYRNLFLASQKQITLKTTGKGSIENLYVLDNAKIKVNRDHPAKIDNIYIHDQVDKWEIKGWVSEVKGVGSLAKIHHLYVNDKIPEKEKTSLKGESLHVASKEAIGLVTIHGSGKDGSGAFTGHIGHLHIDGAAKLRLGQLKYEPSKPKEIPVYAMVKNVEIADSAGAWVVDNWIEKAETVQINSGVTNLHLSDKVNMGLGNKTVPKTLRIASERPVKIYTTPEPKESETAKTKTPVSIDNLHIHGDSYLYFGRDLSKPETAAKRVNVASTNDANWRTEGWLNNVEMLEANSQIDSLFVSDDGHTRVAGEDKERTLRLTGNVLTKIQTGQGASINNLFLLDKAKLDFGEKDNNAVVKRLILHSQKDEWRTDGWASGTKDVHVFGQIDHLYVHDHVPQRPTSVDAKSLRVATKTPMTINTVWGAAFESETNFTGKIKNLHIEGANRLVFGGLGDNNLVKIEHIKIPTKTEWQTKGWVSETVNVGSFKNIDHLYVAKKPVKSVSPDMASKTLRLVSNGSTAIETDQGNITNLHIYDNVKLTTTRNCCLNVENLDINSYEHWVISPSVTGVKSITANMPKDEVLSSSARAMATGSKVIQTIDVQGIEVFNKATPKKLDIKTSDKSTPVQISATESDLIGVVRLGKGARVGDLKNVNHLNIASDSWDIAGVVTNPRSISVGGEQAKAKVVKHAKASTIHYSSTGKTVKGANVVNVAFDGKSDTNDYMAIYINSDSDRDSDIRVKGKVGLIDFSDGKNRPNLMVIPTEEADVSKMKANADKVDMVVFNSDKKAPKKLPEGFTAAGYLIQPETTFVDLKRLDLYKVKEGATIKVGAVTPGNKNELVLPFSVDGVPKALHLKTAQADEKPYTIDFSASSRPATTFEIVGGEVNFKGNASKGDRLMLGGGVLNNDIATIDSLTISGANWVTKGTFSNLKSFHVGADGIVNTLNVTGATPKDKPTGGGNQTLTVQTNSKQPLPITVAGIVNQVNLDANASLGDVKLQGGLITIHNSDGNTDWRLGRVTDAGALTANGVEFDSVKVAKGLTTAPTSNKSLMLNTETKAVSISAKNIKMLELSRGAKVRQVERVNHLKITDADWSVEGAITMRGEKATVDIAKGVLVQGIMTERNRSLPAEPKQLRLRLFSKPLQSVKVNSQGVIHGGVDFTGMAGTPVTLEQTGSSLHGVIKGVDNIIFNGVTRFHGSFDGPLKSVQVKGQVTFTEMPSKSAPLTLRGKASVGANLMIARDASLTTNRIIDLDGDYQQDGTLKIQLDSTPGPLVKADSIKLGPDAVLVFDGSIAKKDAVLMKSNKMINRALTFTAINERYQHHIAALSADKTAVIVKTESIGSFVSRQATVGGASASAAKALEMASTLGLKSTKENSAGHKLNRFVVSRARTPKDAAQLATQLTPDNTGSVVDAGREAQQMMLKAVHARSHGGGMSSGISSGDMVNAGSLWIQYAHNDATQDAKEGVFGFKAKTNGFTLGYDKDLNDMVNAGLAYTYAKGDINGRGGSGSSMDTKNHIFTLYSTYTRGEMFLNGLLSYNTGDNKGYRTVAGQKVSANYDNKSFGLGASGGYDIAVGSNWTLEPTAAFNYYRIKIDDYAEKAADSFLAYDKVSNDTFTKLELGGGLQLVGDLQRSSVTFKPGAKLMAFHDFKKDPVTMRAHYSAGGPSFVVHGAKRNQNRYQAVASLDLSPKERMNINLSYSYDWSKGFKVKAAIARLQYDF